MHTGIFLVANLSGNHPCSLISKLYSVFNDKYTMLYMYVHDNELMLIFLLTMRKLSLVVLTLMLTYWVEIVLILTQIYISELCICIANSMLTDSHTHLLDINLGEDNVSQVSLFFVYCLKLISLTIRENFCRNTFFKNFRSSILFLSCKNKLHFVDSVIVFCYTNKY